MFSTGRQRANGRKRKRPRTRWESFGDGHLAVSTAEDVVDVGDFLEKTRVSWGRGRVDEGTGFKLELNGPRRHSLRMSFLSGYFKTR